ncbi:rhomboid family intramembrane serine protease [Gangjinia marincola]|uniref:Rhomboid family intramembrane serine protease n=1 Tax=Gangjinia marincola TaxID=578463 RepID=A0ABN1MIW2_9FLAO
MDWKQKARYKYTVATMAEKLIIANVVVFVFFKVINVVGYLFQFPTEFIMEWFVLPKEPMEFIVQPWSIITYAFLHQGFFHLLSNVIVLYFAGKIFHTYYNGKRLLNYYFLGAIVGGLLYLLSYNLFPAFTQLGNSYLLGASAGVMAVLVGITTYVPNMPVRLFIFGNLKLWYITAVLVVLDVIQIPLGNAGGHIAHLGGAFLGYFYTSQLQKGKDIGTGFEKLVDSVVNLFTFKKKSPLKTVHRTQKNSTKRTSSVKNSSASEQQQKIDAILDKISKSGYDSLSKKEKDFLFNAGKDS